MLKTKRPIKFLNRISQKYRSIFLALFIVSAVSVLIFPPITTLDASAYSLQHLTQQPSIDDPISPLVSNSCSGSFGPQQLLTTNDLPESVVPADLDGDGKPDLVVSSFSQNQNNLLILRNTSTPGTISFVPQQIPGIFSTFLKIEDLDGDSKLDLVVTNRNDPEIFILRNTSTPGTISFAPQSSFLFVPVVALEIGDLDGDSKPDIAINALSGGGFIPILRNTSTIGTISFAMEFVNTTLGSGLGLAIGDIDGDSKQDLVITSSNRVNIVKNTSTIGNLSFAQQVFFTVGLGPISVEIGDLDGDSKPDIAVANAGNNTVSVLRNTSTTVSISFASQQIFNVGIEPFFLAMGDINGDSKLDLAVINRVSNTVSILKNISINGNISFANQETLNTGNFPQSVAISDLDGDSKSDLAITNTIDNTVSILRNICPSQVVVSSTTNPVIFGQNVTFTATVLPAPPGTGAPTGTVTFTVDGNSLVPVTLSNTQASFSTSSLSIGTHTIVANYNGDFDFLSSMSSSFTQNVVPPLDFNTLYVADTGNNRVQRSTNNGVTWQVLGNGKVKTPLFNAPKAVAANTSGALIFVADTGNNQIQRSTDGGTSWTILTNQVNQPSGLAYDEVTNKLYIADTENNRILVVNNPTTSPTIAIFASSSTGSGVGQFNKPQSVATDGLGKIYVADTANNRIQVNNNGLANGWSIFADIGNPRTSNPGQVLLPKGIYIDNSGRIWVADTGRNRIQVNINGTWSIFMSNGTGIGLVMAPEGVVVNTSGNVFIADTGNNRIQSKPVSGGNASVVGISGSNIGQFNRPSGIR
ncbi:MAG: FG-GAP-like repeat-containing protein [Blastocatellia bacterium]